MRCLIASGVLLALTFQVGCANSDQSAMIQDTTLSLEVREWSKKIREYPENASYFHQRGKSLLKDRKVKLAIADFEKAVELSEGVMDYYLDLANAYNEAGRTKDALETYAEAAKRFPKNPKALAELGQFQYYLLKYEEAEKTLLKAIEIDNFHTDAYFHIGMIRKEMKDTAGAITFFRKTLQSNYDHFDSYMQVANLYVDMGDTLGFDYLSNAARLRPDDPEVWYATGLLYQKLGRDEKAIQLYQKTIDLSPRFVYAYYNVGSILAESGNYGKAIDHFQLAINFAPDFAKAYTRKGQCLELLGDVTEAKAHYERALQIDPNMELAKEGLKRIRTN